MTTIKAHFDGKSIILDEPAELPVDQPKGRGDGYVAARGGGTGVD